MSVGELQKISTHGNKNENNESYEVIPYNSVTRGQTATRREMKLTFRSPNIS